MAATIFTRMHKLREIVDPADLPASEHHYVIGADLIAAMPRADVQRSIAAMIEADMARLPFPELLVEFSVEPGITRFLWLREAPGSIEATVAMLASAGLATVPTRPACVTIESAALRVENHADARDGAAIAIGAAFALLMLNVRGVDKLRVDAARLNIARAKAGKSSVPTHTVLRIGIVYDREGKPTGAAGIKNVYLRAGHVRQQACGPQWRDHKQSISPRSWSIIARVMMFRRLSRASSGWGGLAHESTPDHERGRSGAERQPPMVSGFHSDDRALLASGRAP